MSPPPPGPDLAAKPTIIHGSVAWRLLDRARRLDRRLIPQGTRARWMRDRLVRALKILVTAGPRAAAVRTWRFVRWQRADAARRREHAATLARILALHPDAPVVVFLPAPDCGGMGQRPQQLAWALAAAGMTVIYCTTNAGEELGPAPPLGDRAGDASDVTVWLCRDRQMSLLFELARPVLVITHIAQVPLIEQFRRPRVVYDHSDALEVWCGGPPDEAQRATHLTMVRGADVILTAAPVLHDAVRVDRPDVLYAPDAVDPAFFARGPAAAADLIGHTWAARAGALRDALAARARAESERPTLVVLAAVPVEDSGGGGRPARLAMAFLVRGWRVVHVHLFERYGRELHLAMAHPWLTKCSLDAFARDIDLHLAVSGSPMVALVECPHPDFAAAVAALRARHARIVYDLIDDWDSELGRPWYNRAIDRRFIEGADVLVASSAPLRDDLAARTGRAVALARNAVETGLFDREQAWERPRTLVSGRPTCLYVGALWGQWFDWELLGAVARALPAAAFVLVGDDRGQRRHPPANVHFVGLQPRAELPAWLAHADVALIPFIASALTAAVSPLKVFEYVAMGVPVVSTPMPEVVGIPGVTVAHDVPGWVQAIRSAVASPPDRVAMRRFALDNTWDRRVDAILAALDEVEAPASTPPPIGSRNHRPSRPGGPSRDPAARGQLL